MPAIQEAIRTVEDQLRQKKMDHAAFAVDGPEAGTVLPPTLTTRHEDPEENSAPWSGTPMQPENLGAYLETGVLFCQIGDPKKLEAVLVIDQSDRNIVREDQAVDLKLEGFSGTTLHSRVAGNRRIGVEGVPAPAVQQVGRRGVDQNRSSNRRRKADEHVVSGPRAGRQSRRFLSDRTARPGLRAYRVDFVGRPALAADSAYVQLQGLVRVALNCSVPGGVILRFRKRFKRYTCALTLPLRDEEKGTSAHRPPAVVIFSASRRPPPSPAPPSGYNFSP